MNVNDVTGDIPQVEDKLKSIFDKQRSLMEKYEQIEDSNGLLQTRDIPVSLDDNKGQARLKDFCWRATEELAEAYEAYLHQDKTHLMEELADALHFLVELCILSGIEYNDFVALEPRGDKLDGLMGILVGPQRTAPLEDCFFNVIYRLGLAANCLKNKPWKVTHMKTDVTKYQTMVKSAFVNFIYLCVRVGFDSQSLYDMYFKKNKVNQFRQESNY